jgi:hypothetical protein
MLYISWVLLSLHFSGRRWTCFYGHSEERNKGLLGTPHLRHLVNKETILYPSLVERSATR